MRRPILLLLPMLLCLAAAGNAQNSERRDSEAKLLALERIGRLQAAELKDLKMLNAILDDNFISVDADGRLMNKSQMLALVHNTGSIRYQSTEMSVRMHGATAIVTGIYQLNGIVAGKPFTRRVRFVDTWLDQNGNWRVIASLTTPAN
jgi:Domain of unknown function (DUF4440)